MPYPTLFVRGSSAWDWESNGTPTRPNDPSGLVNDAGPPGVPYTDADVTVFMSVDGSALQQGQATYLSPGLWQYEVPATICILGQGPWYGTVQVFGPGGITDTLMGSFRYQLTER